MFKRLSITMLSLCLAVSLLFLGMPAPAWAMLLPTAQTGSEREADLKTVQRVLESAVIQQRLVDLGLSAEEAVARVAMLPDEQVHAYASNLDSLQAGGDILEALIIVALATVIVVGILQLTGHSIIIR